MELKGSRTEQNLQTAFAGESQARNKYTYFANKARQEGMNQIAEIFEETARNEQEHARLWFQHLNGGKIGTTAENLKAAAEGENYEWTSMYKEFADVAREEGLDTWICGICGFKYTGVNAPKACPVCGYPQAVFRKEAKNY